MMTTKQTNAAILDGITGELAVAFDNTSSTIAFTDNKLSKGRTTKMSRGKIDSRPSVSTTDTAASSETHHLNHDVDSVSRTEFSLNYYTAQQERCDGNESPGEKEERKT